MSQRFQTLWASCVLGLLVVPSAGVAQPGRAAPAAKGPPTTLLDLPGAGKDPEKIDYAALPRLRGDHAVISPMDEVWKFQLHNYLIHHDGKFWCMWSQGPPVEDEPTQHVRYATSVDGLRWSEPRPLTGPPKEGYAYIARGLWLRDGELLALVAHFKGKGAFGVNKELELQAFAWDPKGKAWRFKQKVYDNAINNFAPQRLPSGDWIMTRRDARFNVSVLVGGRSALGDWESYPVVRSLGVPGFRPDEPIFWPLQDGSLFALYRDNGGSRRLFHSLSTDQGKTWGVPALTNFPNATSKIFSLKASPGYRVLISNANPKIGRRELHLSLSEDGKLFTRMALLAIPSPRPATLQYPHAVEHEGHLYVAFSRNKKAIEVLRIPLKGIDALRGR